MRISRLNQKKQKTRKTKKYSSDSSSEEEEVGWIYRSKYRHRKAESSESSELEEHDNERIQSVTQHNQAKEDDKETPTESEQRAFSPTSSPTERSNLAPAPLSPSTPSSPQRHQRKHTEKDLASSSIAVNDNTSASAPAGVDETDQLIRDPLSLPGIRCDECGKRYRTKGSLSSHRYMHKKKKQKSSSQGRKGQQVGKEGGVKTSEQNGNAMMEVENDKLPPNEDHLEEMLTQVDMIMEKEGTGESSGE